MNTFLGASTYLSPDDVDEALRALGALRLSRRLYVGPAGGQGGVPQGRPHRPRGGRARGADAVRRLLRRPLSRRVHRSDAHRHRRHRVRQHRRGAVALSRRRISTRRSTPSPPRASARWSPARRRARSSCRARAAPKFPRTRSRGSSTPPGAGDLFAAGYLAGLARGAAPAHCARLAALAASEIIQHIGARPETSLRDLAAKAGLAGLTHACTALRLAIRQPLRLAT